MAKYNSDCKNEYAMQLMGECFRNSLKYYKKNGMENFKGVMVGATNFRDNLDQAIMRRFTFKLQFDYLDEVGKRLFFERMFKAQLSDEESARLAEIGNLAPGDFRTVRQSMYYLGGNITNMQRIEALRGESEVKRDSRKPGRIGFGVNMVQ